MNKKLIRLTESDLHRIVKESVSNILNESEEKILQRPEVGPSGVLNWASGIAWRKSRDIVSKYEELMRIVQKADTEERGSYFAEKLKELSVGYKAIRELGHLDEYSGGKEGSGFSSNGIGYY